jgi:hypothetical protein
MARLVAKHLPGIRPNALQAHWERSVTEAQDELAQVFDQIERGAKPLEKARRKGKADAYLMAALHLERNDMRTALVLWRQAQRTGVATEDLARLLLMAMDRPQSLARQMHSKPLEKAAKHALNEAVGLLTSALEKAKRTRAEMEASGLVEVMRQERGPGGTTRTVRRWLRPEQAQQTAEASEKAAKLKQLQDEVRKLQAQLVGARARDAHRDGRTAA